MDKEQLVQKIMEKSKDFTQQLYLAAFLFAFILLIVFIIRPSVSEYVNRHRQLEETKQIAIEYQKVIVNLTKLQSVLESHRDDFVLLEKAVPKDIGLYQLAGEIEKDILPHIPTQVYEFPGYTIAGSKSNAPNTNVKPIPYVISTEVQGSYSVLREILKDVSNQSRVKTFKSISINRTNDSSSSGNLLMKMDIQAYHL